MKFGIEFMPHMV